MDIINTIIHTDKKAGFWGVSVSGSSGAAAVTAENGMFTAAAGGVLASLASLLSSSTISGSLARFSTASSNSEICKHKL